MKLKVIEGEFAICRLPAGSHVPAWAIDAPSGLFSLTRTPEELSIVCPEALVPAGLNAKVEPAWRAIEVQGPLDFAMIGVLASLTAPLAQAGVSVFAISTFDTDYILVKQDRLADAVNALRTAGMEVEGDAG